jgi:hypothetical protein
MKTQIINTRIGALRITLTDSDAAALARMGEAPPCTFSCNCISGETRLISATQLEHKCGMRPSASYGANGVWTPYVADSRGRWWVDWQSTPKAAAADLAAALDPCNVAAAVLAAQAGMGVAK